MKILSKAEMEKLPTKRLLAYKTRLLKVRDYCCYCGDPSCPSKNEDEGEQVFDKTHPTWKATYAAVKEVLTTREHVERK